MSVIAIIGDVHLGHGLNIGKPGIGNALNSRIMDQIFLLNWSLEQVIKHNVDTIIFTGDIFHDEKPDYRIVNYFIEFLKTCENNNIDVHIVIGNHDIKRFGSYVVSVLDMITSADLPKAHVYKSLTTIYADNVGITLMPFRDKNFFDCETNVEAIEKLTNQLVYEAASIPTDSYKILVGHLALEGSIYFGDEYDNMSNELMCPLNMFLDYDYIWMGHVHKPQVMCQEPYISHIGSIDISDFGEQNHRKNIVIFDTDNDNKFVNLYLPTRSLRHILIQVNDVDDPTEYTIKAIKKYHKKHSLKEAIVRIEIKLSNSDSDNINRDVVEKIIYDLGAFYICSISESKSAEVIPIDNDNLMDKDVIPKEAVKLFAEQEVFDSEDDKNEYITIANSIIDKYHDS